MLKYFPGSSGNAQRILALDALTVNTTPRIAYAAIAAKNSSNGHAHVDHPGRKQIVVRRFQDSGHYQGKERLAIRPALLIGHRKITGRELFPDRVIMHGVLGKIGPPIGVLVQIPIDLTNGSEQVKTDREEENAKTNLSRF